MNEIENSRLVVIENEIKDLKKQTALGMLQIGDRLLEAKDIVPYGKWESWLADNVEMSSRTARNLMRIAQIFKDDRQALADLEVTKLYYLAELPEDKRNRLLASNNVSEMSTRELKAAVNASITDDVSRYALLPSGFQELNSRVLEAGTVSDLAIWISYLEDLQSTAKEAIDYLGTKIQTLEQAEG